MSEYCVSCGAWIQSFEDDLCQPCAAKEFESDDHECDDECGVLEDEEP